MIDFDVVAGPGPAEKPIAPTPKPPPAPAERGDTAAEAPGTEEASAGARSSSVAARTTVSKADGPEIVFGVGAAQR